RRGRGPAAGRRGRPDARHPQRRDLQPPRPPLGAGRSRTPLPDALRRGDGRGRLRAVGPGGRGPAARDVRPRRLGRGGALPTYYLAQVTSAHVTVALNGDGGDELFAGYPRYAPLDLYRRLSRVPPGHVVSRVAAGLAARRLPARARWLLRAVSAP